MAHAVYKSLRAAYRKVVPFRPDNFLKKREFTSKSLSFRDDAGIQHTFQTKAFTLRPKDFVNLGLNPELFIQGMTVHLMDAENCKKLARLSGLDVEKIGGFYPLSRKHQYGKEEELVTGGRQSHLSPESRCLVLPEQFSEKVLLHELLHDIYLGGAISQAAREDFVKLVISTTRYYLNRKPESAEANFLREVGGLCREHYNIDEIANVLDVSNTTREQRIFAGEVFAYAGEIYLGYKGIRPSAVPEDIIGLLESIHLRVGLGQKLGRASNLPERNPLPVTIDPGLIHQANEPV